MATLLAKRAGAETPIATDDTALAQLTSDPTVPQFPSGGFGSAPASSGFGSPSSGFGATQNIGTQINQAPQQQFQQQNQAEMLKSGGGAMQEGGESKIAADQGFSDFINKRWRPLMAVIYMVTCTTDFVLFPVLWSLLQAMSKGQVTSQWMPLTLQGAGLYHIAMGAVLGLAAYGRSQEKIAGKA